MAPLISTGVAGHVGEGGIALELGEPEVRTERRVDRPDEVGEDVLGVVELDIGKVAGVPGDVGDEERRGLGAAVHAITIESRRPARRGDNPTSKMPGGRLAQAPPPPYLRSMNEVTSDDVPGGGWNMHVNRKTLYLGVFLIVTAGVMLAGQADWLDLELIWRALELWPLVVIAMGAALLLRGTRVSLAAGVTAAILPGLLLGGVAVAAPRLDLNCGQGEPASYSTQDGTFDGAAAVTLDLSCGQLTVRTGPGSSWRARTADGNGLVRTLDTSGRHLMVSSGDRTLHFGDLWDPEVWEITLPTDVLIDLSVVVNAGEGDLDLSGARLGVASLEVNAGDVRVDLTGATLRSLALETNAGATTIRLPAGFDYTSSLNVNAGSLSICTPEELGVRIRENSELSSSSFPGFARSGDSWLSPNYASAANHADVTISVNVGSVEINPEGDCT